LVCCLQLAEAGTKRPLIITEIHRYWGNFTGTFHAFTALCG
jgi:hypothetical protein